MAGYVDLPSGRTWYAEHGTGAPDSAPLVLLHGGVVDGRFFDQNVEPLAARFHVFVPDLRAHGHTPDADGPLSYERLARDITEFLEVVVGGPAHVVGHSIGAGVALTVALRRPDLVRDLVLVSGAYHHDGVLVGGGDDDVDVEPVVAAYGAAYAAVSPDGADHYPVVIRKVADMDRRDPAFSVTDLAGVASRTLVMAGDDDIITLEHTVGLYRGIGNSELAIVPGTSHFLLQEKPELCNAIILAFVATEPVATVAPMRRATVPVEQ